MVTITDFRLEWARECDVFLSTHRASILLFSTGFVPPSGTSQASGQSVGAVNPPQLSTGGEHSLVAPSQRQQGRSLCKWNDVECHGVSSSHCAVLLKRLARWECFYKNKTGCMMKGHHATTWPKWISNQVTYNCMFIRGSQTLDVDLTFHYYFVEGDLFGVYWL